MLGTTDAGGVFFASMCIAILRMTIGAFLPTGARSGISDTTLSAWSLTKSAESIETTVV